MSFVLSGEQKNRLSQWRASVDDKENQNWYSKVKQASIEFNEVLREAKVQDGGSLTPNQIDRLFKLMKRLSHNRALSKLLYEENGLAEFNNHLRDLLFGSETIAKRIDQFRELKGAKEVTMSHFLCLKDPTQYPYISTQTFDTLELEASQEDAARVQALREHKITNEQDYHETTIRYLRDWVIFKTVKDEFKLESYPLINFILWDAYAAQKDRPPSLKPPREGLSLYEPLAKTLRERASGMEPYWVKVTAQRSSSGEWTRPDIASVSVDWFDYLPQKFVQVTSYEVKKRDSYDLSSVYEASAHQRIAHRTYLVLEVTDKEETIDEDVEAEAARLGVGIMKAYQKEAAGPYELEIILEPDIKNPEPSDLNEFIEDFFEDDKDGQRKYKQAIGK